MDQIRSGSEPRRRAAGRPARPAAALVTLLAGVTAVLVLAQCTSGRPAAGSYQCVDRTARAAPPAQLAPVPIEIDKKEGAQEGKPLLSPVCPDGQVPVGKPAQPTVAKGNPLIGPVEGKVSDFFGAPKDQAPLIQQQLQPFDKVYNRSKQGGVPQAPLADPPGCNGVSYYGSCFYYGSAAYQRDADGGGMTTIIQQPAYDGSGGPGHSLDEISVQGGEGNGNIVELGWNVSTSQYDNANPHLFVYHWMGWTPTCYDGCNWQQYSSTYFPGMDLGALVGKQVYIGYVYYDGNWWAWFDDQWLGYFPGSEWDGSYTHNSMIQWFGEVSTANGLPPHTDMGDGLFPADTGAALNATLCDVSAADWVCWYRDQQSWGATYTDYYDINRTGFGETRFGGPGE